MSPKLIVILGATGKQGSGVVDEFINDKTTNWKVRAVSRDPTKPSAKNLEAKGVEVVKADINDVESLIEAFKGANVVYGITDFWDIFNSSSNRSAVPPGKTINEYAYEIELKNGKNIVDATATIASTTLELFIWSELSAAKKLSKGKYNWVYHFDSKAAVTEYARTVHPAVAAKTSCLRLGLFTTNWQVMLPLVPKKQPDGVYEVTCCSSPDALQPFIVAQVDSGKYVLAILKQPPGTTLFAYTTLVSMKEYTEIWGRAIGKPVRYVENTVADWDKSMPGGFGREVGEMMAYSGECGYNGGETGILTPKDVGLEGQGTTLEDYFKSVDWSFAIGA